MYNMNQSIITGFGTPQLSRILEEGDENSRRTDGPSLYHPTQRRQNEEEEEDTELNRIEDEISSIGRQLQSLHNQMKGILDKYSEQYLQKQARRNTLRKRVIDLDFFHKTIFAKRMRRNNGKSIIHQFYYSQPQKLPTPPKSSDHLASKDKNEATSERMTKFASPTKSYRAEQHKNSEKRSEKEQRRVRTAEKQQKGSGDTLRVEQLTKELVQLRTSYSTPYLYNPLYPIYDDYYHYSAVWPY